jgi:hypothetical protein
MSIWDAAEAGDLAEVQGLIGEDPRLLNAKARRRTTPLTCASERGHVEVVRWLVDQGAALDEKDCSGYTALSHATRRAHPPVVRLLLDGVPTLSSPKALLATLSLCIFLSVGMSSPCVASWTTPAPPPPSIIAAGRAGPHCGGPPKRDMSMW